MFRRYRAILKWGALLVLLLSTFSCFDRYPFLLDDMKMPGVYWEDYDYSSLGVIYIWFWYEDSYDQTIYYTLDGTDPTLTNYSVFYQDEGPVEVYPLSGDTVVIKAVAAWPDYDLIGPMAETWYYAP